MLQEAKKAQTANRTNSWHRPMYVDGRQVAKIRLFDKDGVWLETRQGWFEHQPEGRSYSHDVYTVYCGEAKRALKENFKSPNPFYIKDKDAHYSMDKSNVILYLPIERVEGVEKQSMETASHRYYHKVYQVPIECDADDVYLQDGKAAHRLARLQTLTLTGDNRSEETDFGQKCAQFREQLKAANIDIDGYNAEKLLKAFEVTPRAKPIKD